MRRFFEAWELGHAAVLTHASLLGLVHHASLTQSWSAFVYGEEYVYVAPSGRQCFAPRREAIRVDDNKERTCLEECTADLFILHEPLIREPLRYMGPLLVQG